MTKIIVWMIIWAITVSFVYMSSKKQEKDFWIYRCDYPAHKTITDKATKLKDWYICFWQDVFYCYSDAFCEKIEDSWTIF